MQPSLVLLCCVRDSLSTLLQLCPLLTFLPITCQAKPVSSSHNSAQQNCNVAEWTLVPPEYSAPCSTQSEVSKQKARPDPDHHTSQPYLDHQSILPLSLALPFPQHCLLHPTLTSPPCSALLLPCFTLLFTVSRCAATSRYAFRSGEPCKPGRVRACCGSLCAAAVYKRTAHAQQSIGIAVDGAGSGRGGAVRGEVNESEMWAGHATGVWA